jgi:hypothetical protein
MLSEGKKTSLSRSHAVWFHSDNIIKITKLEWQRTDECLPETKNGSRRGDKLWESCAIGNGLSLGCTSEEEGPYVFFSLALQLPETGPGEIFPHPSHWPKSDHLPFLASPGGCLLHVLWGTKRCCLLLRKIHCPLLSTTGVRGSTLVPLQLYQLIKWDVQFLEDSDVHSSELTWH